MTLKRTAIRWGGVVLAAGVATMALGAQAIAAPSTSAQTVVPRPYQPLWPFSTSRQVQAWQKSYRQGGHSPWRLDPKQTALYFANGYLGFSEIERTTGAKVKGNDAHIGVGYRNPDSHRVSTVAVLHLLRVGKGKDRPWEVVGSDDKAGFVVTTPHYGTKISSNHLRVGGRITGVDESIRVRALQPGKDVIGTSGAHGAGGHNAPWSIGFSIKTPSRGQAITLVAWTGGHVAGVERFVITAVVPR